MGPRKEAALVGSAPPCHSPEQDTPGPTPSKKLNLKHPAIACLSPVLVAQCSASLRSPYPIQDPPGPALSHENLIPPRVLSRRRPWNRSVQDLYQVPCVQISTGPTLDPYKKGVVAFPGISGRTIDLLEMSEVNQELTDCLGIFATVFRLSGAPQCS